MLNKIYDRKLGVSETNKIEVQSFGSPIMTRTHLSQGLNHPRDFSKGAPVKQLMIKIPMAGAKGDENIPISIESVRNRSLFDINQLKNEVTNAKTEFSLLKNDISINSKNLKEIDVNMITSPTQKIMKTEIELGPTTPIHEVPYNHFYKALGLASRKKDIENFRGISTTNSNLSGLGQFPENYQKQVFSSPIQMASVDCLNKENSGDNASLIKIDTFSFNPVLKTKIKSITYNHSIQKN